MQITVTVEDWETDLQLNRAFENVVWPSYDDRQVTVTIDAPKVQKFVNCFLNSNINARVEITPPADDVPFVNYAGLFSGCTELNAQPIIDNSKNKSMAAMFKNCRNFRVSLHNLDTSNVIDFRQCFYGATFFSGNGIQSWDFSAARSPDAFRNFFGNNEVNYVYYDQFILSLYDQMKAGTLPTPMHAVDMGNSKYSPYVAIARQAVIDYGWEILDGGQIYPNVEPSELEKCFLDSVVTRLENNPDNWLEGVDMSPITTSSQGGALITPRHMIFTNHWPPGIGKVVTFWNGATAKVVKVERSPAYELHFGDIVIATLDRDVTECNPIYFLPYDWVKACPLMGLGGPPSPFPLGMNTPLVWFDQRDQACVSVVSNVKFDEAVNNHVYVNKMFPMVPQIDILKDKFKAAITGDSGSPQCFLCGDKLVLSHLVTSGGPGGGSTVFFPPFRKWLDEYVGKDGYKVTEIDF